MSGIYKLEKKHLFIKRLLALSVLFILFFIILFLRLIYLQIIQGDRYKALAERNRISERLVSPPRGYLYDRNGVKLAENRKTFHVLLIKEQVDSLAKTMTHLNKLIHIEPDELARIGKDLKKQKSFLPVLIKEDLDFSEIARLSLNAPDLSGVFIEEGSSRLYPLAEAAAHSVGYISLLNEKDTHVPDDFQNIVDYRTGRTGAEKFLEETVRGTPGTLIKEINAQGRSVRILKNQEPQPGTSVKLTLDARLQRLAYDQLKDKAGAAVLMDVHTGAILALVSTPSFDPNLFNAPISAKEWKNLMDNKKRPLQNKALAGQYSPGSIFKIIVALAGLESGDITPGKQVYCSGKTQLGNQTFHCWKKEGHGPMTVKTALQHSCDVYFYEMAQKIGADKILSVAQRLGFGSPTGIPLSGEKTGLLPSKEWKKKNKGDSWRMGDTLNLSIGQGFLSATPIQMVRAVAQVANGGYQITPFLVQSDEPEETPKQTLNFNPVHLKLVKEGMAAVVNEAGGTAYGSRFDYNGQQMAGKTASTQVRRITLAERKTGIKPQDQIPWEQRDHAIFVAYAPVQAPKYAVVVLVEHGISGSRSSAPIARELLKEALRLDDLAARGLTDEEEASDAPNTEEPVAQTDPEDEDQIPQIQEEL